MNTDMVLDQWNGKSLSMKQAASEHASAQRSLAKTPKLIASAVAATLLGCAVFAGLDYAMIEASKDMFVSSDGSLVSMSGEDIITQDAAYALDVDYLLDKTPTELLSLKTLEFTTVSQDGSLVNRGSEICGFARYNDSFLVLKTVDLKEIEFTDTGGFTLLRDRLTGEEHQIATETDLINRRRLLETASASSGWSGTGKCDKPVCGVGTMRPCTPAPNSPCGAKESMEQGS
jgi:hypothetical protein